MGTDAVVEPMVHGLYAHRVLQVAMDPLHLPQVLIPVGQILGRQDVVGAADEKLPVEVGLPVHLVLVDD